MAGLSMLWSARSIAIVGASTRPGALGRLPIEFLLRYEYQGRIYPINPNVTDVCGLRAYPDLNAVDDIDLALIMVGADKAVNAVAACASRGVPAAIVAASGFAEAGETDLQAALVAARGQTRLLGPNCIGAANLRTGLIASFSPLFTGEHTVLKPGGIALVSQSGALGFGAVSLALERGLGLGWAVTTGNEADATALEILAELAGEPECTGLLGYVESLTDGPALRRLAAVGKPTALLVTGRSVAGRRAAASHTGVLSGDDRIADAVLHQLGIVRVLDIDELLDVGEAFASGRRPQSRQVSHSTQRSPRIAVITTSGGSGILAADAIDDHGLQLATLTRQTRTELERIVPAFGSTHNPIDVTAAVMRDPSLIARCLAVVDADDNTDAIVVCFCVLTGDDVAGIVDALTKVGKPVVVARTGAEHLAPEVTEDLRAVAVPLYPTPARAVRALAALRRVPADLPGPAAALSARDASPTPAVLPGPAASWDGDVPNEAALKRLLQAGGIPVPRGRFLDRPADFDFPAKAVLKAVVPGLVHKTEAGGVIIGVTAETAAEAYAKVVSLGGRVWAEEYIDGGVEMLVGIASSPLGRILTLGAGGVMAELLDDVAIRLLPGADAVGMIPEMLDELRAMALLRGYRGRGPFDVAAFIDVVSAFVRLTVDWPAELTIELNPVVVRAEGAVVLDAVCVREAGGLSTEEI